MGLSLDLGIDFDVHRIPRLRVVPGPGIDLGIIDLSLDLCLGLGFDLRFDLGLDLGYDLSLDLGLSRDLDLDLS